MNIGIQLIMLLFLFQPLYTEKGDQIKIDINEGEYWWGGLSSKGFETPYDKNSTVDSELPTCRKTQVAIW